MVFGFLANDPPGAMLLDHEPTKPDLASALSLAARVCKSWCHLAIALLYKHVLLRDNRVCVLFARTLRNANFARIVISIQLPQTINLPHKLSKRQRRASVWISYFYETKLFTKSRAVGRIVAAAVNLQSLRGPFGGIGLQGDVALARLELTSKLQHLYVHSGVVRWTTWMGALNWREKVNNLHLHLLLRPTTSVWNNLHKLVITAFFGVFNLMEFGAARFAEALHVLRELVIVKASIAPATLGPVLSALRNTLRALTLWQAMIEWGSRLEPLFYVENSCEPGNQWRDAFDNLEHLTCGGTKPYHRPVTSSVRNIGTLTRLKSLGVSSDVVSKIAVLPPQLTRLIIHLRDDNLALACQKVEEHLNNWILHAPGFRQLIFSAPGFNREDASDRQVAYLRLRRLLQKYDIQLSFEMVLV